MKERIQSMTDAELIAVVRSADCLELGLHRRFPGDDTPLVNLMDELGLAQNMVEKLLVTGAVMRECLVRNILVPPSN